VFDNLKVTADPSRAPERPASWYVVTDQGVVLAGPYDDRADARMAYDVVVAELRHDLMRARKSGQFIHERVAAVGVRWGRTVGAWGGFEAATPPST